jgi:hypothetical protein
MLTVMVTGWLKRAMANGGDEMMKNSGELLWEGIRRFAVFLALLDKLLLPDAHLDEALFLV